MHDSYNNDILKINNGAAQITVEGNMFYNQTGSDEHIDVNSVTDIVIQDNIFFNDFAGSGRSNENDTSRPVAISLSKTATVAMTPISAAGKLPFGAIYSSTGKDRPAATSF
jgi:hypothetical protein